MKVTDTRFYRVSAIRLIQGPSLVRRCLSRHPRKAESPQRHKCREVGHPAARNRAMDVRRHDCCEQSFVDAWEHDNDDNRRLAGELNGYRFAAVCDAENLEAACNEG